MIGTVKVFWSDWTRESNPATECEADTVITTPTAQINNKP